MFVLDVNILIYTFDTSSTHHQKCYAWLTKTLQTAQVRAPNVVLSGFLRIVTNTKIFPNADTTSAWDFVESLESHPNFEVLPSSVQHWLTFKQLCQTMNLSGNDFSDAFIAAFALEYNATLVSADKGFARFQNLNFFNPVLP
jgi:toxin-antitoxin system PIN domain toxin